MGPSDATSVRPQTRAESQQGEQRERSSERLLLAISRVQSLFIDDAEPESVFGIMLQEILLLTGSEYGFIGEVLRDPEQQPYLRVRAITGRAWNEATKALMAQHAPNLEFRNLKTLFGRVMTSGCPVIANDPLKDPRAAGFPPSHPPIHAFLGIPIRRADSLTGMVGVANRPGGYDETVIAYLDPFLSTCAQLVEGYRNRRLRAAAEEALRQSEDRFRAAVHGANAGIWDWNLVTNETYFSPRWKSMLGYEDTELANTYSEWESRLHADDRDQVLAHLGRYLDGTTERYDVEFRMRKKSGDYCWIHACGSLIRDTDGRPVRMAGSHEDIAERKQEEALQAAEKHALELVAKGTPLTDVLVFICRAVETQVAPTLCSIMLVTDDGAHLSSTAGPSLPEEYHRAISRVPIGPTVGSCGSAAYFGKPAIVADIASDPLWKDFVSVTLPHGLKACWSLPIISSTDMLLGTLAAYHREPQKPRPTDLKILGRASQIAAIAIEHAKMTEALRASEARFHAFMRHNPAVTFIKDEAGRHIYVNPQFETLFGVSREAIKSKTAFDFLPADIATRLHQNDELVFSSWQALESEELVPALDGKAKHWLVIKFPLEIGQRRLLGGVAIDITERKSLEQASHDQADRLRLAMDIARLATWDWNILTNQITWSDNCEEVKGLPRGSFDGTFETYQRLVHPEDLPELLADIECALSGQKPYYTEHRIVPPIGEVQWVEGNGVVYRDDLGRPIRMVGTVKNVTERKHMEQTLRVSEERYSRATGVGRVGVWELDVQAGIYYGDKNLKAMFGYKPDELSTEPLVWLNLVHQDDQSIAMAQWQRIVNREADEYNYELRMNRKDGTVIWTDIRGHAIRTDDGELTHLIGATLDITDRKQAEDRLRRTQFAMDQAVDAVYWIDPEANILYANEAASAMLGYTADEFLRLTVHDLNPEFPREVWPAFWERTREQKVISLETVHLTKDGRRIPIEIRVGFLAHDGQEFHCAFVRDISERKLVDQALRASQERFELAVKASNDGIWDWNILTGEQYWSNRHLELLGLTPGELAPTYDKWISMLHPDDAELVHHAIRRHLETRASYDLEVRVRMKDGSYRWFRDRGQALWDESGRPVRMVGSVSDVTERRQTEEAIWKAHAELEQRVVDRTKELATTNHALEAEIAERKRVEDRLQRTQYAVDHAADQIFVIDSKGYFLDVNESACRRLGFTKEELLRMSVMEIDPDFPPEAWDACWEQVRREGQLRIETRHRSKSGEIYPVEVVANYLCHNGQELDCAIVRDVTERKRIEDRLQRTQYAIDHAADQIFVIGSDGYFLDVNHAACRRLGYAKEELLKLSVMDIDADCPLELWHQVWAEFTDRKGMRLDRRHRSKTGEIYPVEVLANYIDHQGQPLSYSIVRDVTERRQAEAAIRESELRYKLLTEATFDGVALHDDGVLLEVNPGLERMFGYEPGELIGRSIFELVIPEQRAQAIANMRKGVEGPYEIVGLRKDGSTVPGEVVVKPYTYRGKQVRLVAGRDITVRKQLEAEKTSHLEELEQQVVERTAEIARLESQRAQVEKLAAVGQLAAAVAHEINNPIAGIKNAFLLVKQAVDPAHPHYEFVGMIDREIARVATIVQNMYQLYRKEPSKVGVIDLHPLLRDLEALFAKRMSQRGITFAVTLPPHPVMLQVPQGDLLQVLMNLIQNAMDASDHGKTVGLNVDQDDSGVRIRVSDEGGGIAPDVLPHIFDPFFTTKTAKNQKGMGLGLSVSQSLVMAMGGRIEVQTELGAGSSLSVVLPRSLANPDSNAQHKIFKEVLAHDS